MVEMAGSAAVSFSQKRSCSALDDDGSLELDGLSW